MTDRARRQLSCILGALIFALAALFPAHASEFGRNGFSGSPSTNGGATCTVCHGSGASLPQVTIAGPSIVDAGTVNEYTVTISGGPAVTAGVGISVSRFLGSLTPADSDLDIIGNDLSHAAPKAFQGGDVEFSFTWTAPPTNANVMLYAAGNSTDGQLDLLGDGVGNGALNVSVRNGSFPPPPPPPVPAPISLDPFATGLSAPVVVTNAGDERLFVVERRGRIRIVDDSGDVSATPFLDIESRVDASSSEMGLLGLVFHPDYASNGYFYVYYTRDPGSSPVRSRVSRFAVSANSDVASQGSERVLMEFEQPASNHNAGDMHFGSDGLLYIASGDGGPSRFGQDDDVLLGKMLRIDVDTTPGSGNGPDCEISGNNHYSIPSDNTYVDGSGGLGCDEIYATGLRNPWRFSFDRETDDLWIGDVGAGSVEEINFVLAGASGGINFGWNCYEGDQPFGNGACDDDYFFPVHAYSHAGGNCSVTGGFVYRGLDYPSLNGTYFFTDFCNTAIRAISGLPDAPVVSVALPHPSISSPSAFGEDVNGELYVLSLSRGILYRLRGQEGNRPPSVTNPGNQTNDEGDSVALAISASDSDGDPLIFGATGLPPGLSIGGTSGIVSGTLDAASAGSYNARVNVIDGNGGSRAVSFSWTVNSTGASPDIIVDNQDADTSFTGVWRTSTGPDPYRGESVYNDADSTFRWAPRVTRADSYQVFAWWTHHPRRSSEVPYRINHAGGSDEVTVDQSDRELGGRWNLLGTFDFAAGSAGYVEVSSRNGQASADAVRLVPVESPPAGLVIDNQDSNTSSTGTWRTSTGASPYAGQSVYNDGGNTFRWIPQVSQQGSYAVYAWWTHHPNRSDTVPYRVRHANGTSEVTVDQEDAGLGGRWNLLGTYEFAAGNGGYVEVSSENGQASADAVRLVLTEPAVPEVVVDNRDINTSSTGRWLTSTGASPYEGESLYNDRDSSFRWVPEVPVSGSYKAYAWWTFHPNRSSTVPYRIRHAGSTAEVTVDQHAPALAGQWNLLGIFNFDAGSSNYIEVSSENGQASADAVRLVKE